MNEKPQSIKSIMQERLKGLLRKPAQAQKDTRPKNKIWIASFGFNGTMFFLDLVSAITVALLTSAMYGMMTFLAGFLALLLHENLFTNAHAGMTQKYIAIAGGILSIVSTVGIGILAGIVNITNLAGLITAQTLELGIVISLVCVSGIHGVMWGIYYFTDAGHVSQMKAQTHAAYRAQQRQDFENAKQDIVAVKEINNELESMGNDAELINEAFRENTGRELIQATPISTPAGELTSDGFKYHAETPAENYFRPDGKVQP